MSVAKINVYIGTVEECPGYFLYVDLSVGNKNVCLWESFPNDMEDIDIDKFMEILNSALDISVFFAKSLKIPMQVDTGILDLLELNEVSDRNRVRKIVKEALNGIKP